MRFFLDLLINGELTKYWIYYRMTQQHIEHVEEEIPWSATPSTKSKTIIDEKVLSMTEFEVFEWFLENFVKYTRNEINWIEVRSILDTASAWKTIHAITKTSLSPWQIMETITAMKKEMLENP